MKDIKILDNKNYESEDVMVSHPSHYISESGLEVIQVVEAFTANLKGIEATDTGNVIKYICRWKEKNGIQDLEKAKWYLTHLINHLKNLEIPFIPVPEANNCNIDVNIRKNIKEKEND